VVRRIAPRQTRLARKSSSNMRLARRPRQGLPALQVAGWTPPFGRYKYAISDGLPRFRKSERRSIEVSLAIHALNRIREPGRPTSFHIEWGQTGMESVWSIPRFVQQRHCSARRNILILRLKLSLGRAS
jgi:hypothetical protein